MTKKLTNIEFLDRLHNKYGNEYIPLEDYKGYDKQIEFIHTVCGEVIKRSPNKLLTSNRVCQKCYGKINVSRTTESFKEEIKLLSNDEYELLSDYIDYNKHVEVRHKVCGHKYLVTPSNFIHGYRCNKCCKGKHDSLIEKEIVEFIKAMNIDNIKENDRKILNGKELDIYLPGYKIGIELNGEYWHSDRFQDKHYHLNKYNLCKEKGITLITIWEDEYKDNKSKYYNIIKSFIDKSPIYDTIYKENLIYVNKDYEDLDNVIYEDELDKYYEYIGDTLPELINRNNHNCWNVGYKIYKEIK